jgi:hypothetical protein
MKLIAGCAQPVGVAGRFSIKNQVPKRQFPLSPEAAMGDHLMLPGIAAAALGWSV